jgi:hypothetical protein
VSYKIGVIYKKKESVIGPWCPWIFLIGDLNKMFFFRVILENSRGISILSGGVRLLSTGFPSKTVGRARKRDFWHEGKTFYHGHGKEENIVGNLSCVLFLHNTVFFFMKMQLP